MVCFDDLAQKDFQALKAIALRNKFSRDELAKFSELAEFAERRGQMKHGRLHWKLFLHADRLFQTAEPELLAKLVGTMREADESEWKCLDHHEEVNVRVIEYHHYDREGGLTQKNHFDGGSLLTMVVMVSDPSKDFEGGRLQTWECDGSFKEYDLQQGDCVVFPSCKFHNVTPVTSGVRNIVAVELWTGDEGVEDIRPGAIGHLIPDVMGS